MEMLLNTLAGAHRRGEGAADIDGSAPRTRETVVTSDRRRLFSR